MIGTELPVTTVEEACRVVRALGGHRYVGGRQHHVHALALEGASGDAGEWARAVLTNADIDQASRDERLWRACTEAEIADVLARFWGPDDAPRARLRDALLRLELPLPEPEPFDESREDDLHPLMIDAGWELLALAELDAERHKGAIAAYGEHLAFEVARFEEQESMPKHVHLYELPAFGPRELLEGASDGSLLHSFVLYTQGEPTYVDYVLRGVLKVAKIG
jgi:hypothetical protein